MEAAMTRDLPADRPVFLSTMKATRTDWRLAVTVIAISAVIFFSLVPVARIRLAEVWAFIPIYETALAATDLMTVGLLLIQFSILRSRALLVLACGYLF